MKKVLVLLKLLLMVIISNAQQEVVSNGCFNMLAKSKITSNGAVYETWLNNNCNNIAFIDNANYKVKFEYRKDDGKKARYPSSLNFKHNIFLAPNSSISSSEVTRWNGTNRTFISVYNESGGINIDPNFEPSNNLPQGYLEQNALVDSAKVLIDAKQGVNFYLQITYNYWRYGLNRAVVSLIAENTSANKFKEGYEIDYSINFYGKEYSGSLAIKKVNPNSTNEEKNKLPVVFNFTPQAYYKIINSF